MIPFFTGIGIGIGITTKGVGIGIAWNRLFVGIDSSSGIDSTTGIDSATGIDSNKELIPCDSNSNSFGSDSNSDSDSGKIPLERTIQPLAFSSTFSMSVSSLVRSQPDSLPYYFTPAGLT